MTWADLFARAPEDVAVDDVRHVLAERRDERRDQDGTQRDER